ncbi:MAG TPA: oxygenase MpaB family protein, partial [Solirubrobacterales bacterium]|nr:oxygenase MpaB family protein [Solirubrobacterales bacterium]
MKTTALTPTPGSVSWRYAGDARLLSTGAYALLLQVAHPTVGAGVTEHSNFRADPWGRLLRTLDYSYAMTYGGPEAAAAMGRGIREMHRRIKGVKPSGERYHALEPEAYAWVHATLAHSIVRGHELLGKPMAADEIELFYLEWRRSGELIGVRERDLPDSWEAFGPYFERMTAERLE